MGKTTAEKQRDRRQRLKDFAAGIGFSSWAVLETAILDGRVTVTGRQSAPQPAPATVTVAAPVTHLYQRHGFAQGMVGAVRILRQTNKTYTVQNHDEFWSPETGITSLFPGTEHARGKERVVYKSPVRADGAMGLAGGSFNIKFYADGAALWQQLGGLPLTEIDKIILDNTLEFSEKHRKLGRLGVRF